MIEFEWRLQYYEVAVVALSLYDYFLTLPDEVSAFPSLSPDYALIRRPRSDICGEDRKHGVSRRPFLIPKTSPDGRSLPIVPLRECGR